MPIKALDITNNLMKESSNQDPLTVVTHAIGLYQNMSPNALQLLSVEFQVDNNTCYYSRAISNFMNALHSLSVGMANDSHGPIKKAVAANWNSCVRLQPWSMSVSLLYMVQGYGSWNSGDIDNALASFVSAVDISPASVWGWFCIGVLHLRHGLYNLALPNLNRSLKICSKQKFNSPLISHELACCLYFKVSLNIIETIRIS
ncbi:hypothetical protein RF11_01830 [Thelohanellus kitauei]|uniref:Uncharacterized protein n=1 Tax=Thelohanellus kitauei TaxID=669202 RepID=A0A0C2MFC8_THEKT|nr:hypothetical protein RF11_01830 [Thelohanellus kitauei]